MIKLYVSEDSDILEDCLFADETKLFSYFEETDCELGYEDCKLFLLEDYVKDKDQQIAELKQQVKAKDILIDTYMSVVGTLTNAKNLLKQLEIRDKALNLAREYMFKGMCSDDVPCVEWFIKCAEEQVDG